MAAKEELEVIINPDGRISMRVRGMPGKACLEHEKTMAEVGRVIQRELTAEFYQQPVDAKERQKLKARREK